MSLLPPTGPVDAAELARRRHEALHRIGGLHVLTDTRGGRDTLTVTRSALAAGAGVVQVRVKGVTDRELFDLAARVVGLCAAHGATCLVNDRVDVAMAVGAHGTHLGATDLPVPVARRLAGPHHLLGGTARTAATAQELVAQGADYLGVGPVHATTTKTGLPSPLGTAVVAEVASSVGVPVIAIGGVTAASVGTLRAAGAAGVAVVSAISDAPDVARATHELLSALHGGEAPR